MWSINKYLKILVPTLFILMVAVGNVSAAASVLISPDSQSFLSAGDTFSVDVVVDSDGTDLSGFDIRVAYDTSVLSVTGATYSGLMSGMLVEQYEDDGEILVAVLGNKPYSSYEEETILTIDFKVMDGAEDGTYSLDFKEVRLQNENGNDLSGTATGSIVGVGIEVDATSTPPGSIDLGSPVKSTSVSSSTSVNSVEQVGYSYIFGSTPDDYEVLDRYGQLQTGANWSQEVLTLEGRVEDELKEYFLWHGKVTSLGTNSDGYLVVVFYEPLMVERSEIEDIYDIIDAAAKDMDIKNVPVEFGEGSIPAISDDLRELMTRTQEIENEGIGNFTNAQSSLYDPAVIATFGDIPRIRTEKECWQWYFQDSYDISLGIGDEFDSDLRSGVLLSTRLSPDGYFEININQEADVDRKSLTDEVYAIINREALDIGVSEVPVVFKLAAPDESETLASTSEEETVESEDVENQVQETPGFNIAISLLSISMVCHVIIRFGRRVNED
jgi:hypothetical protein